MQIEGVDFFVYEVSDLERSVGFYRDVIGLTHLHTVPERGWAEFEIGTAILALRGPQSGAFYRAKFGTKGGQILREQPWPAKPTPPRAAVALRIADVRAAVEKLRARGVLIVQEPFDSDVCHIAGIEDPDGNLIYLHRSHTQWG